MLGFLISSVVLFPGLFPGLAFDTLSSCTPDIPHIPQSAARLADSRPSRLCVNFHCDAHHKFPVTGGTSISA